jgi:hypothetical protein
MEDACPRSCQIALQKCRTRFEYAAGRISTALI